MGDLSFSWKDDQGPKKLLDPSRGEFTDALDEVREIVGEDDELLFVYCGHAYPVGGLAFPLKGLDLDALKDYTLEWVVDELFRVGFGKIYLVIDACHSGILSNPLKKYEAKLYCGLAGGLGHSYGHFSESFLEAIDGDDSERISILTEPKKGAITFGRAFHFAKAKTPQNSEFDVPISFGLLGNEPVKRVEFSIPESFQDLAPPRTVYRRIFRLLGLLKSRALTFEELLKDVRGSEVFLVADSEVEQEKRYISSRTLRNYLSFIISVGFCERVGTKYSITADGAQAADKLFYNGKVVDACMENLFPEGVDASKLRQTVFSVLERGLVPSSLNVVREIDIDMGFARPNFKSLKMAFTILPYTGAFQRAPSDSIFP
ncbi:MAG: hypothetical protein AAFR73_05415 [Pseudomonadota bacterium]